MLLCLTHLKQMASIESFFCFKHLTEKCDIDPELSLMAVSLVNK